MTTINEIQLGLQNLLERTVSQVEIGKALGTGRANINYRIKYKSKVKIEELKKIEEYFNVDLSNFIERDNIKAKIDEYLNSNNEEETLEDCLSLPVRGDVNASMGYGVTVYDEKETGVYHISKKLALDLNINKNSSEIIFASGDSMYPTIQGGDSLLIDRSKKEVHDGRIYCVRIDGQIYAKRLQKIPPATIVVISDNQKYKSFEINLSTKLDYDFEIIGEIKWWGRIAR